MHRRNRSRTEIVAGTSSRRNLVQQEDEEESKRLLQQQHSNPEQSTQRYRPAPLRRSSSIKDGSGGTAIGHPSSFELSRTDYPISPNSFVHRTVQFCEISQTPVNQTRLTIIFRIHRCKVLRDIHLPATSFLWSWPRPIALARLHTVHTT